MIYSRVAKGVFPMFGSGKTLYHPLYIDNLVDAFLLAQEEDKGLGQAYLIADEHFYPIEELVKRVAKCHEQTRENTALPGVAPGNRRAMSLKRSTSPSTPPRPSSPGGWTGTARTGLLR